ncbi:MAG: hypothetical protein ACREU3_20035, partial [Steroidobacteraceae bacterium]
MRSTWQSGGARAARGRDLLRSVRSIALGLACALALQAVRPVLAQAPAQALAQAPDLFPRPRALAPAIRFWTRVYTQIDTNAGYLHDEYDLSVIYATLHFAPDTSRRARERSVAAARARYVA